MPGKSPSERRAIEKIERAVMTVFESAGFEHVAPDILQPADIFLERSGEDIKARTYVFTDPGGSEMCLRPDLTVPACRYHLSHAQEPQAEARYCYCGPAFRFPNETASPGEFGQAGIEWFSQADKQAAEARVLKLAVGALEAAGVPRLRVTMGDLGLFHALLADTPMPERWRKRLKHQFWRPKAFRDLLGSYATARMTKRTSISDHVDAVAKNPANKAVQTVDALIATSGAATLASRSPEEIAARLLEKAADRQETPIEGDHVARIDAYLALAGDPFAAIDSFKKLNGGPKFDQACMAFSRRLEEMEELGLNPRRFQFEASFGRSLEYYTGFVFQIEADSASLAGGGRYDELLSDMGSPVPIPAVGCAIHIDRLHAVLGQRA
jgi:ATP phosphoribosyltransferase regulatory subunit